MSSPFFFFFQQQGKESAWKLDSADNRQNVLNTLRPAFSTVLDLTTVPTDNDWSKVKYKGPFYADFDAEDELELVCEQFKLFLLKLSDEYDFDLTQARLYATGSKGFHVEIDQASFMPKPPVAGTGWLAYIYRSMAEATMVDTLDLNVYTGKKGRQWRTPNVKRSNGCYKVALTLQEAMEITPESYLEIIQEPRLEPIRTPAHCNSKFAMAFERAKEKTLTQMRGKKKRQIAASVVLDPWKKAKKTPPTIEGLMTGEIVSEGAGFQDLAMQLSIYAVSVEMAHDEFIERCAGLCAKHVSDSRRYNSIEKRREELSRMWNYMNESSLYDFDVGPLRKLVKASEVMSDLGFMQTEDKGDEPQGKTSAGVNVTYEDGDEESTVLVEGDLHKGLRKGFFMNADGMWKKNGDIVESVCRATLRNVVAFYDAERGVFLGYEFDVVQKGSRTIRTMLGADAFASATLLKKFFVNNQISFQGGDFEVMSLMDIMAEKSRRSNRIYVYPREGFMLVKNPHTDSKSMVKVYLTQDTFRSSLKEDDPDYFELKYRPAQALSSFAIDIHNAPDLDETFRERMHDLFAFNRTDIVADLVGWMVGSYYRSAYLSIFNQFPLLQVYGEAGSGKSQTIWMLAHMHWHLRDISIKSAATCTSYVLDCHASSSTSAPLIMDEFKPRELVKQTKGKYEKLKDMFKASYIAGEVGERGTINRGAENSMGIIKNKATAPIVFMGEAIEMETAIIERSVTVPLSKQYQTTARRQAFLRLHSNPLPLSALGKDLLNMGFRLNLEGMRAEVEAIIARIEAGEASNDDTVKGTAPRMIYNRAVIIHALGILKYALSQRFGTEFDAKVDELIESRYTPFTSVDSAGVAMHAMSEASKVMNRMALLSREVGAFTELLPNKDYLLGEDWLEIRVERAYDQYRRYCAGIHDTPLFDSLEAFLYAMNSYSPAIDRVCVDSLLRDNGSSEKVIRFNTRALTREGVQTFRSY